MKKTFIKLSYVILSFGLGIGLAGCTDEKPAAQSATATDVSAESVIIAVVNGVKIPQSRISLYAQGQPINDNNRQLIIDNMVSSELISQEARSSGLADKQDVRGQLVIAEQTVLGRNYGRQYLEANPITEARISVRYQELVAESADQKEYDVAHILVAEEGQADELFTQIKADNSQFGALATEHSADPGSSKNEGKLGWASARFFVPEFAAAMQALAVGEMSAPVKTDFGWHIIRVDAVRENNSPPPEFNDEIRTHLEQVERADIFSKHINALRQKATVEIL